MQLNKYIPTDEDIKKRVIYCDSLIIIFNKPSGIAVHQANQGFYHLEQYFHNLRFDLPYNPLLAHRLDYGTSGCLLLARMPYAAGVIGQRFKEQKIKKTYWALVHGNVRSNEGIIDIPLSKISEHKQHWWMKADPYGNFSAITRYKVLERMENRTLLELYPETGRTHQLRVHCAYIGNPIVGDYIYDAQNFKDNTPLHLHARKLDIELYPFKPPISVTAPNPDYFLSTSHEDHKLILKSAAHHS